MGDIVIRVEGLGKEYRIGGKQESYRTLRDSVTDFCLSPLRRAQRLIRRESSGRADGRPTIWALKDVSLEVKAGEVIGIIGRNGAGKTTLLKILSRITEPTEGVAEIRGRVRSLLEVGTGFHPELTGRENIYLNGAIMGMRKEEVDRKFDEIVAFAQTELFLDTPVKHYSSGMYVRLAFAVAAHLDAEILLVDEVLAVGDAAFQKKCLQKIEDVSRSGRTILYVSHNMPSVLRLCQRAILMSSGEIVGDGPPEAIVADYMQSGLGSSPVRTWSADDAPGNDFVRLRSVRAVDADMCQLAGAADVRRPMGIEIVFDILEKKVPLFPMLAVHNELGVYVFNAMDTGPVWREPRAAGRYVSTAWIPGNLLSEGLVIVSVFLNSLGPGKMIRHASAGDAVAFYVVDPGEGGSAKGDFTGQWGAAVSPLLHWTTRTESLPLEE